MNRKITSTITSLLLLAAGAAQAAQPSQAIYGNELQRCVSLLSEDFAGGDIRRLRHTVTDVETRGLWYEFDIRSEAFAEVDGPAVRTVSNHCRAHRWEETAEVTR